MLTQFSWQQTPRRRAIQKRSSRDIAPRGLFRKLVAETLEQRQLLSVSPAGAEFRLNTQTLGMQYASDVAMSATGEYVAVWSSNASGDFDVRAQRYNADGVAQGSEFRVNTYTTGEQALGSVAMDAAGNFVVAYQSMPTPSGPYEIRAQRYTANGALSGSEFLISSLTFGSNGIVDVAMDADGDFVAVWTTDTSGTLQTVARRFNSAGVAQGAQIVVGPGPGSYRPQVAMDSSGNFIVAWEEDMSVQARRYNAAGTAQGAAFTVNSSSVHGLGKTAVAMDADGDFAVAWHSYDPSSFSATQIFARRFNSSGTAQGADFRVNDPDPFPFFAPIRSNPALAMDSSGDLVVTWESQSQGFGNELLGVYARRYTASGQTAGSQFHVNTNSSGSHQDSSVAVDAAGNFVVAWTSSEQDGNDYGVYAQRYNQLDSTFDIDGRANLSLGGNEEEMFSMAVQPDGKVLLAGSTTTGSGTNRDSVIVRYNLDGSLDTTFDGDGIVRMDPVTSADSYLRRIVLQPDGKIVVVGGVIQGGGDTDTLVMRFNANGTLDTSFGPSNNGKFILSEFPSEIDLARGVALDSLGRIVVVGSAHDGSSSPSDILVFRLTSAGVLDTTFSGDGIRAIDLHGDAANIGYDVVVQFGATSAQDKIVLSGYSVNSGDDWGFVTLRLLESGSFDNSFSGDGVATTDIDGNRDDKAHTLALQPPANAVDPAKVIVAGTRINGSGIEQVALRRYNNDGTDDSTFGSSGDVLLSYAANQNLFEIAVQADGKILVPVTAADNNHDFGVLRLTRDGIPDVTFGNNGLLTTSFGALTDMPFATALDGQGRVVVGGYATESTGNTQFAVARFLNDDTPVPGAISGRVFFDFEGDGVFSDSDYGISGVQVQLYSSHDSVHPQWIATTDASGQYLFASLLPDTYKLTELTPSGFVDSIDTVGSVGGSLSSPDSITGIVVGTTTVATGYDFSELFPVSLQVTGSPLAENGGVATVTASVGGTRNFPVDVHISFFNGTATLDADFSISGQIITIPPGSLSGSITMTALPDTIDEFDETILITNVFLVGANWPAVGQLTATIIDDDVTPLPPAGSEFRVNTYTTNFQYDSATAMDAEGKFVVVWASNSQDGDQSGIYAQRFNAAGAPWGSEFRVNERTTGLQSTPTVALDDDGDFVVTWSSYGQDGDREGIYARLYDRTGTPKGSEFRVNTYTTGTQSWPVVGMDSDGDFVIAYTNYRYDGPANGGIYAQRFNSAGAPQGSEFRVNTYTFNGQQLPAIDLDADGDFVVAWTSYGQPGDTSIGIYARSFDRFGTPQGGEFHVNSYTLGQQTSPSVALDTDGNFAVSWTGYPVDHQGGYGIYARRYSSMGEAQGTEFRVASVNTNGNQQYSAVAFDVDGDLVVTWQSYNQDGSDRGIFARRYNPAGVPGSEFRVNVYTTNGQYLPAVASGPSDTFVVTWTSDGQDGSSSGVYGRRYGVVPTLKVTSLTPTSTGFIAQFDRDLDTSMLNLYDQGNVFGAADVLLTGTNTGGVRGSVVVDPGLRKITFIKTDGALAADNYTVTLKSGTTGFQDRTGIQLDGDSNGTSGDQYTGNFTIGTPAGNTVTLTIPDFARGNSQAVNLPDNLAVGIPITISTGLGISGVDFHLHFDPALLSITAATLGTSISGGSLTYNLSQPGDLVVTVSSASQLSNSAGTITLATLTAQIPANAVYATKQILDLTNVHVYDNSAEPAELPSIDNDGIQIVAYFGDANGSQTYNAPDTLLAQRINLGTNSGLSAYQLADPHLIVDINGNRAVQANDATLIQRAIVGTATTQIPPHPGLSPVTSGGADPIVFIPRDLVATEGETVAVPVEILVTESTGITLGSADFAISYDASKFALGSIEVGQLMVGFGITANQSTPGLLKLSLTGAEALSLAHGAAGTLATLHFTVLTGAGQTSGINLLAASGLNTALYDAAGNPLTLSPAPTDAGDDSVDGLVTILSSQSSSARTPQALVDSVFESDGDFVDDLVASGLSF